MITRRPGDFRIVGVVGWVVERGLGWPLARVASGGCASATSRRRAERLARPGGVALLSAQGQHLMGPQRENIVCEHGL